MPERADPRPATSGFFRTVRTVASALVGVRGRKVHEADAPSSLSPLQILITALVFMLIFVLVLVTVAIKVAGR